MVWAFAFVRYRSEELFEANDLLGVKTAGGVPGAVGASFGEAMDGSGCLGSHQALATVWGRP